MPLKQRKRTISTSATIAVASFNLPVMIIAGLIIGFLLSVNQDSPFRELILIGTPIFFFIIAIIELYYVVNKQQPHFSQSKSSVRTFGGLAKLIKAKGEEE
jgi:purine-cytosine permease-like protein